MGKKRFGKKVLAGIMSLALAASILPAGAILQEMQVPVALAEETQESGTYKGFYADYAHARAATEGSIIAYVNGSKEYKTATVYTDVTPDYVYTTDAKGKLKSSTSKVLVATSTSNSTSPFKNGKVNKDDNDVKAAQALAKASIKNGIITVTAQKKTTAADDKLYLWVTDCNDDTYKMPVTIKLAPTKGDVLVNGEVVKTVAVNITKSAEVNLRPYFPTTVNKQKTNIVVVSNGSITFKPVLDKNAAANGFSVAADQSDPYKFTISATKLANNKPAKGKVTFQCNEGTAKISVSLVSVNQLSDIKLADDKDAELAGTGKDTIEVTAVTSAAVTATVKLKKTQVAEGTVTDTIKVIEVSETTYKSGTKFEGLKFKNGVPTANPKVTATGVKAALARDTNSVTVTVNKKSTQGPKAGKRYFLILANNGSSYTAGSYLVVDVK